MNQLHQEKKVVDLEIIIFCDYLQVTGAGHGIGQELAVQFGELGAVVVCLDINEKGNEETIQLLKEKGCTRAHAYK